MPPLRRVGKGGVGVGGGGVDLRGRPGSSSSSAPRRHSPLQPPLSPLPSPPLLLLMLLLLWGSWASGAPLEGSAGQSVTPPHPDLLRGCVYGGSEYAEGQAVATEEQCLNCTCSRGALVCHLKACPPLPKISGCTAVRKTGHACCPSIVCDEVNNTVGRVIEEMNFGEENARNTSGCDVDGKVYAEDSSVPGIAGRCEECHCSRGKVECGRVPCSPEPAGCTPLYSGGGVSGGCCPSGYDCPSAPALLLGGGHLGSNIESVLAPPSHEELMSYLDQNSTEEIEVGEKGKMEGSGSFGATISVEGILDDAQSAAPPSVGGLVYGDSRQDRHMETSTLEKAPETSTPGAMSKGVGEGDKGTTNADRRPPPPGGSAGEEVVKAANGSLPETEEKKMVMGDGKGGEGGPGVSGTGTDTTEAKQLLAQALAIAETDEGVTKTKTEEVEGDNQTEAEVETTTLEDTTDTTTAPEEEREEGGEGTGATMGGEAEATTIAGGVEEEDEKGEEEDEEPPSTTTPASTIEPSEEGVGDQGDNETTAYSADEGGEGEEEQGTTEYPGGDLASDYSSGNDTADSDYERLQNASSEDNSTAVDELLDSLKNVSSVLGAADGGLAGSGEEEGDVEGGVGGSANATGGAAQVVSVEEKTMDKMILAEEGGGAGENATGGVEAPETPPLPANGTAGTETDHLTTTVVSIERKKDMDYEEFDYNEPTLPPSLPNLRIIPFVAADAVLDKDKHKSTEAPIFFDGVPPSLFSPPVETEGGFVPRDPPILDGGLHDVTYKSPILSDNLPSFQNDIPLTGIAAIELTTTSKPNVQGDYGLQSLVANGTLGSSVLDSLFSPLDQLPPEKGTLHALLSPIVRPSFLDSKIIAPKPMLGSLTFYNNASHYPPLPTPIPSAPGKGQMYTITHPSLPPTKIPSNYNAFPSSSHKGTAGSPLSTMRNTANRPPLLGITPATTTTVTNKNSNILAMMASSPSGGSPSGNQRRPLPSSDRVSVIPLGPTPPRPSPSTSAPYSVGPNLPPTAKPISPSPPSPLSMPTAPSSQNPPAVGLLKLAGCNIYGRMYRVGRIISELSGPCLECRCTEVGVQCRPLPC